MITVDDVIRGLPRGQGEELVAPDYESDCECKGISDYRVGLYVESMKNHTTDEGYQIYQGLASAGYYLYAGMATDALHQERDVRWIMREPHPHTIVLQDKREWEGLTASKGFDNRESFINVKALKGRHDVFKLTILKDAQNRNAYHHESADEIGCHAWIVYYHSRIIKHVAPFVRERHLVRTYHTVDKDIVPPYTDKNRKNKALLSGAISGAYPLRQRLHKASAGKWDYRMHPGYGRTRCDTPEYIKALSHYKVAICTASKYGYATRKIIEATAAGCRVITDLPSNDILPGIDDNLTRVNPTSSASQIAQLVDALVKSYDPIDQYNYSEIAKTYYDYRKMGKKLADDIEAMRSGYNG